ncbi:MAG: hypothetical protein KGS72_06525, partial [Cyanobacteria bacterium REEB67]|nr:hypothetical protein [Cyanobacteria bacterium REEB67]
MTEENPDNKIEDEEDAREKKAPGFSAPEQPVSEPHASENQVPPLPTSAGPQPFVAPPYRERVHSRRLQPPAQPAAEPEAPAAAPDSDPETPGQSTASQVSSTPDMSMYLSRRSFGSASGQFPAVPPAPQQNFAPDSVSDSQSFAPDTAPLETFAPPAVPSPEPESPGEPEPLPLNQFIVDESAPLIDPREAAYIEAQELAMQR